MRPRRPSPFDLALAASLAVLALAELLLGGSDVGGSRAVAIAATLAMTVPLAWRRVHPVPVATVIVAALAAALLAGVALSEGFTPLLVLGLAVYAVARADVLEDEMADYTDRAAQDERERIARELHDVVAHRLSAIAVQAGAGMHVLHEDPQRARKAFAAIDDVARSGLAEMRRALGLLRAADGGAALAPQPSLRDLERLIQESRDAGLPVELVVEGDLGAVPAGLDLSAYRIVQEALTNVRRHAPGARATVRVISGEDGLRLHVVDDGGARSSVLLEAEGGVPGHGLVGMRERATLYGGAFDAGRTPEGGFAVSATLPIGAARA